MTAPFFYHGIPRFPVALLCVALNSLFGYPRQWVGPLIVEIKNGGGFSPSPFLSKFILDSLFPVDLAPWGGSCRFVSSYNSKSSLKISCQGNPCLLSCSMNGSGSNSSTFQTPGRFHRPLQNIIAPIMAGTPVV